MRISGRQYTKGRRSSLLLLPLPPLFFAEIRLQAKSLMSRDLSLDHIVHGYTLRAHASNLVLREQLLPHGFCIIDELVRLHDIVYGMSGRSQGFDMLCLITTNSPTIASTTSLLFSGRNRFFHPGLLFTSPELFPSGPFPFLAFLPFACPKAPPLVPFSAGPPREPFTSTASGAATASGFV
jgi:hypothetical protein